MRKILLIVLLAVSCQLSAGSFQKSYYGTPLHVVLQDLEHHFGCSFMCRPQDIASAPAVGGTYIGSDVQLLLRKILGNRLTFVVRKNIIVITPAPEKTPEPEVQPSAVSSQPSEPEIAAPDTLSIARELEEIEMLRAYNTLDFIPLDSLYDYGRLTVKGKQYDLADERAKANGISHAFLGSVGLGYGSELQTNVDLRYVFYFYRHWGISAGLFYSHSAQPTAGGWLQEGRFCLPLGIHMRWLFTPQWGIHTSASVAVSWPVYKGATGAITSKETDETIILRLDAIHPIGEHTTLLTGVYGDFSGTGLTPWSVGLRLGFQIGK
jgi:hypothetical protein